MASTRPLIGLLLLACAARGQDDDFSFEKALAAATGPAQLKELHRECGKRGLSKEKKKVEAILAKIKLPAKPAGDYPKRVQLRERRAQARNVVNDFKKVRIRKGLDELREIVAWMRKKDFGAAEARERVLGLARKLAGGREDPIFKEIEALPSGAGTPPLLKELDTRLRALLRRVTSALFAAVEKCLQADEPGLSFELFRFLLTIDPENPRAHMNLGHKKVEDRWLRPYEAKQFKAGLVWDPVRGWILAKEKSRYEKGEHYDLATKQWAPLSKLNAAHAKLDYPWILESEHFLLLSTADHKLSIQVLARLEAFFLQAFSEYDLFFSRKSSDQGAKLIFGVAPMARKLTVNFYRDAEQFRAHARPPTKWAAGFYSGRAGGSFFHAFRGRMSVGVLQHELTHQILGEFSRGGAPSWISEGSAVYLQDAHFQDGVMTLGGINRNGSVRDYRRRLQQGKPEHSFTQVIDMWSFREWDQGDISSNYRGAGAVVYFLMHFDGGRYRGDFLDLLRDAHGRSGRSVEDYFGLSVESLDFLMNRFYRECTLE